jgi:hypothetical protein
MSTPIIVAVGCTGMLVFMVLAWWVWKRGSQLDGDAQDEIASAAHAPVVIASGTQASTQAPGVRDAAGTVAMSAPRDAAGTVAISRAAALAIAGAAPPKDEPTQMMSMDELELVAEPQPISEPTQMMSMDELGAEPEPTQFMPMDELGAEPEPEPTQFMPTPEALPKREPTLFMTRIPPPELAEPSEPAVPSIGTETISADEIKAIIAQHRRVDEPAPTPVMPAPTPPYAAPSGIAKLQPPAPAPSRAGLTSLPDAALHEHFEGALVQLERVFAAEPTRDLDALAAGPEKAWRMHLDVLALTAARSLDALALPLLRDAKASAERRRGAAAVALELEQAKGHEALLRELATLDAEGRAACTWALARWGSERAEGLVRNALAAANKRDRMDWLQVLEQRGSAGDDLVVELLDSKEPVELAWALRMLVRHPRGKELVTRTGRHVMMGPPTIRMAALRAALAFRQPAAWTQCKTASRDPVLPDACVLLAMLGSASEIKDLATWAGKPSAPAHVGWALGVSGRAVGIAACVERVGHSDAKLASEALAGFRHATGYRGPDAANEVRTWWAAAHERFIEDRRHVGGEAVTLASIRAALAQGSPVTRAALLLELQIRSPGRAPMPSVAWPARERAAIDALASREIDLDKAWK